MYNEYGDNNMLKIYKKLEQNQIETLTEPVTDSWIHMVNPTKEEIDEVTNLTEIDRDLITKVLDLEELPRIEKGKNGTLIIVNTPDKLEKNSKHKYKTIPLGIIITDTNYLITVTIKENEIINEMIESNIKELDTAKKTRFTIQILLKTAVKYLKYLNMINEEISNKERILYKSTQNKELSHLLSLQKSLVYFVSSLKANDIILEKLNKGNALPLYEEDLELLEDAIIENRQGIEMANIYREILDTVSDTYATIISNNLNSIMKFLAGITIVFSIPTMIASFLGMNVPLGFLSTNDFSFIGIIIVSIIISFLIAKWLKKKNML